jgi:hypothetical protein
MDERERERGGGKRDRANNQPRSRVNRASIISHATLKLLTADR